MDLLSKGVRYTGCFVKGTKKIYPKVKQLIDCFRKRKKKKDKM